MAGGHGSLTLCTATEIGVIVPPSLCTTTQGKATAFVTTVRHGLARRDTSPQSCTTTHCTPRVRPCAARRLAAPPPLRVIRMESEPDPVPLAAPTPCATLMGTTQCVPLFWPRQTHRCHPIRSPGRAAGEEGGGGGVPHSYA